MKKAFSSIFAFALTFSLLSAQEDMAFKVEVSSDSILMGNYFKVSFSLESTGGDNFQPPLFEGFDIMSGPNYSSSISMINGEVSQRISYTYYLRPRDVGNYYIEPASIAVGEKILETTPVPVIVVPNPDGVIQEPEEKQEFPGFNQDFWDRHAFPQPFLQPDNPAPQPEKPMKRKRKTYKI
ncbi:MAG: BatD family protein [Phaeodactylibacter sp.]|nr:BatD family protein [Phaeodactylibacter sp.]MCB9266702.1 BatD family protein [Lewinellaceae bacterium]MCB9289013.1 BatD family protein [Lewinellaceae bacterium]